MGSSRSAISHLDLIDSSLTTVTTDENGVLWYTNPAVRCSISSEGDVRSHKGKLLNRSTNSKMLQFVQPDGTVKVMNTIFVSLFSRIVLGKKLRGRSLQLLDKSKGYTADNVIIPSAVMEKDASQVSKDVWDKYTKDCNDGTFVFDNINTLYTNLYEAELDLDDMDTALNLIHKLERLLQAAKKVK